MSSVWKDDNMGPGNILCKLYTEVKSCIKMPEHLVRKMLFLNNTILRFRMDVGHKGHQDATSEDHFRIMRAYKKKNRNRISCQLGKGIIL